MTLSFFFASCSGASLLTFVISQVDASIRVADEMAERYEVPRDLVAHATITSDADLLAFAHTHKKRTDLQGLVVLGKKRDLLRHPEDEAMAPGIQALCGLVAQNLGLVFLRFNGQRLCRFLLSRDEWRAPILVQALMHHPSLQRIDLFDNCIDNAGAEFLVMNLRESASLSTICLGGNDLVDAATRTRLSDLAKQHVSPTEIVW
ncbi:MAG: hypothetical protein MHM6MM_001182 [Cercozoa sp. M6MM]